MCSITTECLSKSCSFINTFVQIFSSWIKAVWHKTIYIIRWVWLLFSFKISPYKSEQIELIKSFKNLIIQILMLNHTAEPYTLFRVRSPLEILRNSSTIFRSSHQICSIKKAFLKHFMLFTGKHLCWGLFFN